MPHVVHLDQGRILGTKQKTFQFITQGKEIMLIKRITIRCTGFFIFSYLTPIENFYHMINPAEQDLECDSNA